MSQEHDDKLHRIRHSTAHVMAQAVLELFPEGKLAIGPAIEDGFYYDFDLPRPITPEDLTAIEARMREIIKGRHKFVRQEIVFMVARASTDDLAFLAGAVAGLVGRDGG